MSHDRGGSAGRQLRPVWLVVSLIVSGIVGARPAWAAPIRHTVRPDPQEMQALHDYLMKGPHYWAAHPAPTIPRGIAVLNRDGALKSDLFVDYLRWRWEKNPSQFDHRHPRVGAILTAAAAAGNGDASTIAKALAVPSSHSIKAAEVLKPHAGGLKAHFIIHAEPQLVTDPTTVPEPSSLLLAAGIAGAAVWRRRRPHAVAR